MRIENKEKWYGLVLVFLLMLAVPFSANAQTYKWMNVGSLHNWFSETGCEIEVGRTSSARCPRGCGAPGH